MLDKKSLEENVTKSVSFWKTLPGVLTAFAAIIGAIATLLTALYTTGLLTKNTEKPSTLNQIQVEKETKLAPLIGTTILAGQFHKSQWRKKGGGHTFFANGELSISTKKGDDVLLWVDGINSLENILFAINSRIVSVNGRVGYGQLFWFRDPNNYYYFSIQFGGRFRLVRVMNGVQETLVPWTSSELIKGVYKEQEFKIVTNGRIISLFVDDIELTKFKVDKKSAGGVGFYAEPGLSLELLSIRLMDRLLMS